MSTFVTEVRQTLIPSSTDRFGPLPPLLIALTDVTGLVDAFSYLVLGHVSVANMTGNVVFLDLPWRERTASRSPHRSSRWCPLESELSSVAGSSQSTAITEGNICPQRWPCSRSSWQLRSFSQR